MQVQEPRTRVREDMSDIARTVAGIERDYDKTKRLRRRDEVEAEMCHLLLRHHSDHPVEGLVVDMVRICGMQCPHQQCSAQR